MEKIERKLKIIFVVAAIIFALIVVFVAVAAFYILLSGHTTTRYVDYKIVEKNLIWKNPDGLECGQYKVEFNSEKGAEISRIKYLYKKISGESNEKFIGAWISLGDDWHYPYSFPTVLVHPNNEFDLWRDWHISKIEIYKNLDKTTSYPNDKAIRVVASSKDETIISELIERRLENNQGMPTITPNMPNITKYYVRLSFDESDSIVWATRIDTYGDSIILRCGKYGTWLNRYDPEYEIAHDIVIPSGTPLYDFIMEAIS